MNPEQGTGPWPTPKTEEVFNPEPEIRWNLGVTTTSDLVLWRTWAQGQMLVMSRVQALTDKRVVDLNIQLLEQAKEIEQLDEARAATLKSWTVVEERLRKTVHNQALEIHALRERLHAASEAVEASNDAANQWQERYRVDMEMATETARTSRTVAPPTVAVQSLSPEYLLRSVLNLDEVTVKKIMDNEALLGLRKVAKESTDVMSDQTKGPPTQPPLAQPTQPDPRKMDSPLSIDQQMIQDAGDRMRRDVERAIVTSYGLKPTGFHEPETDEMVKAIMQEEMERTDQQLLFAAEKREEDLKKQIADFERAIQSYVEQIEKERKVHADHSVEWNREVNALEKTVEMREQELTEAKGQLALAVDRAQEMTAKAMELRDGWDLSLTEIEDLKRYRKEENEQLVKALDREHKLWAQVKELQQKWVLFAENRDPEPEVQRNPADYTIEDLTAWKQWATRQLLIRTARANQDESIIQEQNRDLLLKGREVASLTGKVKELEGSKERADNLQKILDGKEAEEKTHTRVKAFEIGAMVWIPLLGSKIEDEMGPNRQLAGRIVGVHIDRAGVRYDVLHHDGQRKVARFDPSEIELQDTDALRHPLEETK